MARKILVLALPFIGLASFFSCVPTAKKVSTRLDQLFERDFDGLSLPGADEIKSESTSKRYPHATFDEVWDSAIIVLMQQGVIVQAVRNSGLITTTMTPPVVVFLEKEEEAILVYLYWMDDLYRSVDEPERRSVRFEEYELRRMSDDLFDKLSTQLYAGKKWKYLYEVTPKENTK